MDNVIKLKEAQATYTVPVDEAGLGQMPVILERAGRPVAAIISADEFEAFRQWQARQSESQTQLERLHNERTAFRRLLPDLLKTHDEQFVAILGGNVIDADVDEGRLASRVIAQHLAGAYIQQVRAEPRIYDLSSPEVVRHVPI